MTPILPTTAGNFFLFILPGFSAVIDQMSTPHLWKAFPLFPSSPYIVLLSFCLPAAPSLLRKSVLRPLKFHPRPHSLLWLPSLSLPFFKKHFLSLFILREREKERAGKRQRKGERIPSRLHTISAEPNAGLKLLNGEITT